MPDVTQILEAVGRGEARAAAELLPLVYGELRRLAAQKLAREARGQTLAPTALVHEAYLRLVDSRDVPKWENRRHFYGAAAEAMRRILVENARRKRTDKRGGHMVRRQVDPAEVAAPDRSSDLVALDDALDKLATVDPAAAELVKLRYFAGLTLAEAAQVLQVSTRSADRLWAYARAWLRHELADD